MKRAFVLCVLSLVFLAVQGISEAGLDEDLLKAVVEGNIGQVRQLLSRGADVNAKDQYGATPLFKAAEKDRIEIARLLIAKGADKNSRSKSGRTPLHDAKSKEMVELLLAKGVDVNARGYAGRTPLHFAWSKKVDALELLLANGADPKARDDSGKTPLFFYSSKWNCWNANPESVRLLLANGADVHVRDNNGNTPLHWVACGNPEVVRLLLANGADVNAANNAGRTPLHNVAEHSEKDCPLASLKLLVENGADVNAKAGDGRTPLHEAGTLEKLEFLLSKGAVPSPYPDPDFLLKEFGEYSQYRSLDGLRLLILRGGDVNRPGSEGNTPLHITIFRKYPDAYMVLLLSNGADVNAKNKREWTPLHLAIWYERPELAALLIKSGADVNAKYKVGVSDGSNVYNISLPGDTPLHLAASKGLIGTARLLIANGADINAKTENGYTPLHYAAGRGRMEMAQFLVANGADVNAKSAKGETPWMIAESGLTVYGIPKDGDHARLAVWLGEMSGDRADAKQERLDRLIKATVKNGLVGSSYVEEAVELVKSMSPPPQIPEQARQYMAQARAALKVAQNKKDLEDAEAKFVKAACAAPWWADAYYNLALVQEKLHEFSKVKQNLNYYLKAAPATDDADAIKEKIYELEIMAKNKTEAEKHINRAAELYNAGDIQAAIVENKKAIRLAPYHAIAYANIGTAYTKLNRYQEAVPELEEAIQLGYRQPYVYTSLAFAYRKLDDLNKAITVLEEGKRDGNRIGWGWGLMHQKLGRYYEEQGNDEKALENFNEAFRVSDTYKDKEVDKEYVEKEIKTLKRRLGR